MGERIRRPEEMATTSTAAVSTVPTQLEEPVQPVAVITLRPAAKPRDRKKVLWTDDTVDNEDMNKKKSKCCCIYEKPRKFDESDSEESEDECEHCFGHVEHRHHPHRAQPRAPPADSLPAPAVAPPAPSAPTPLSPPPAS